MQLIQALRRYRRPVSGQTLADETGVSLRTLYRDIAALQAQGADIEGESGIGYVLKPGFLLPPLMFSEDEIEALVLGARWVASRADEGLGTAAQNLIAKIGAVLPADLAERLETSNLMVGPAPKAEFQPVDLAEIRAAIRYEQAIEIDYRDAGGKTSQREIWPFALGFFENARVVVAWCKLRQSFRHFRADRIASLAQTGRRYPRRKAAMLKEWKAIENIGNEKTADRI
jgi:predicted DNA-binding transcriptional regulator YafY